MEETSTERFLRRMNEQNERIAAQDTVERTPATTRDPIREQRQAERREKLGQLRARTHSGKRVQKISNVLPHINLGPGPND